MIAYLLCDELMFTSRITGTARDLGVPMKTARTQDKLLALAETERPNCVIVDLANETLAIGDLIGALTKNEKQPYVVGYGSHVDTATLQAARDAGCDLVLPRSKFVELLPSELARWMKGPQ